MGTDNLSIKGIQDDTCRPRRSKKKGRKKFGIQARFLSSSRFFKGWYAHGRYHTESARDDAHAALVKKTENCTWLKREFRKV